MKLIAHGKALARARRRRFASGQVLVEACIGMALLVFLWILFTFVAYMSNNRVRTLMAARHAAWLKGNDANVADQNAAVFFFAADADLVRVIPGGDGPPNAEGAPAGLDRYGWINKDNGVCRVTVRFGMSQDELASTPRYPFNLLQTHLPFMPESSLQGFSSVASKGAWPADVNETWDSWGDALGGLSGLIGRALSAMSIF